MQKNPEKNNEENPAQTKKEYEKKNIKLQVPYFLTDISEVEKSAIDRALSQPNENLITKFEEEAARFVGAKFAVSADSAASAFHLCLLAMNLKRGDKVLCSVNCHPFFAGFIRQFDAEPIFVDIESDTFELSANAARAAAKAHESKKLRAIIVSHLAGQATDMSAFYKLAGEYNLKIIEDCTMALGLQAVRNPRSFASIFCPILDSNNPLAQAGFLASNDEELANAAALVRYGGMKPENVSKAPQYLYDVLAVGLKGNLGTLDCALALAQLQRNKEFIEKRAKIARIYQKELENLPNITLPKVVREHIFCHFIVKIDKNRDQFAQKLKENGIETSLHFVPLHLLSYYKNKYNLKITDFPVALKNYQQILSLPIYSAMSEEEAQYICAKIREISSTRS